MPVSEKTSGGAALITRQVLHNFSDYEPPGIPFSEEERRQPAAWELRRRRYGLASSDANDRFAFEEMSCK
jgi:hypothetical protein